MEPQPLDPLRRSRQDRVLAGVCGGLGRRLGVDPVLLRLGAVALAVLSGGLAVLVYLVAVPLIPAEPGPAEPVDSRVVAGIALGVLAAIVLVPVLPAVLGLGVAAAILLLPLALLAVAAIAIWRLASGRGVPGVPS